jgi:hypothetical protein
MHCRTSAVLLTSSTHLDVRDKSQEAEQPNMRSKTPEAFLWRIETTSNVITQLHFHQKTNQESASKHH